MTKPDIVACMRRGITPRCNRRFFKGLPETVTHSLEQLVPRERPMQPPLVPYLEAQVVDQFRNTVFAVKLDEKPFH